MILLWDISGNPVQLAQAKLPTPKDDSHEPSDLAFSPDGRKLYVATYIIERKLLVYDVRIDALDSGK